jgi:hypothetical protein
MLVMGGSVYADKVLKERQSRVAFSRDAVSWSVPQRVLARGDWLWRVTWHEGKAYGIAYGSSAGNAAGANKTPGMSAKLVISDDGRAFRMLAALDVSGSPNEATLRFLSNGDCVALVRRETDDKAAWIGLSSAPYLAWKWQPAGMQVGGPNFLVLKDDSMLASGRQYATTASGGNRTFVGRMSLHGIQSDLTLPSGGDCSYPGMVWDKGMLWLSYYSSHEGSTDIYLAKVRLP